MTKNDVYFLADQSEAAQQRVLLAKVMASVIPGFDKVIYPDWETLLDTFNLRVKQKGRLKTTLCLDEFPYLAKSAPELPSILQKIWDDKGGLNYNLVLCGSSQQLMYGLVLDSSAPLYGRADEIMKIKPMRLAYIQEVLKCSDIEAIEEHSVWGGIPRYWALRLTEPTLATALKKHLLSSQGILYDEPMRLFLDDMRDTVHSFTILSLIAAGCHRLSEIASRLGKPATNLSAPLEKLVSLGYVEREVPFGENYKNSKRSLYKIADQFLNFYFKYVVPYRSFIEIEQANVILNRIQEHFSEYVSLHWEKLCRDAVPHLTISGVTFNPAARWWGNPAKNVSMELDVVAVSHDEKSLLVGECKWSDRILSTDELFAELERKAALLPFAKGKTIIPVLFLKQKPTRACEKVVLVPKDILAALK
ncbi:ATPase [Bacteroidia bacterium]|nr:ATPase [Bacteroidia bacterium]